MAFFSHNAYPPSCQLSPLKPISAQDALWRIQTYLTASETDAHLRPDAIFSEQGITTSIPTASGGITLHQLRRVEAGLKGERLMPEEGEDAEAGLSNSTQQNGVAPEDGENTAVDDTHPIDKSYNEQMLEQGEAGILEGEIGPRTTVITDTAHAQTPASSKKRKAKDSALDGQATSTSSGKKSKKARKLQSQQSEAEEHSRIDGVNINADLAQDEDMAETQASVPEANDPDNTAPDFSKKKKKQMVDEPDEEADGVVPVTNGDSTKKKKKKKHPEDSSQDDVNGIQTPEQSAEKKHKKEKKRDSDRDGSEKKKKKKHKGLFNGTEE